MLWSEDSIGNEMETKNRNLFKDKQNIYDNNNNNNKENLSYSVDQLNKNWRVSWLLSQSTKSKNQAQSQIRAIFVPSALRMRILVWMINRLRKMLNFQNSDNARKALERIGWNIIVKTTWSNIFFINNVNVLVRISKFLNIFQRLKFFVLW